MSALIAFIIGSGPNVGKSLADKFRSQGYQVVLGSRSPKAPSEDGNTLVAVDVTKTESVVKAFEEVNKRVGTPNVVVFNAGVFGRPPEPTDPLSLPFEAFNESVGVVASLYIAAQEALKGFRAHHKDSPKAFITNGNLIPFIEKDLNPIWITIGTQKVAATYYMHTFNEAYAKEGVRFHYAHLVGKDGKIPPGTDFAKSGEAHAKAFWDLISSKEPLHWDYRFTMDGVKYEGY